MKDLRDAIKTLVDNSRWVWDCDDRVMVLGVTTDNIENLIAEYNIHFVEPEDKQLEFP